MPGVDFSIRRFDENGMRRLELLGELDIATVPVVRKELDNCDGLDRVVVDTTALDFIDSTGLLALVEGRDRFGARFELVAGEATDRLLDLTGLREHFGIE